MSSKLSNWPLIRSYGTIGTLASLPAVLFTIAMVIISSDKSATNSTLHSQLEAAGSSGAISAGEVTATASYPNLIVYWIIGSFFFYSCRAPWSASCWDNRVWPRANRLVEESRTAAGGDLRVEPVVDAGNEYGDLQRSFSAMIGSFRQTIGRIDHAAIDLKAAASEMAHTSDEAGHAIGEVAQAISSISEGAAHQVSTCLRFIRMLAAGSRRRFATHPSMRTSPSVKAPTQSACPKRGCCERRKSRKRCRQYVRVP